MQTLGANAAAPFHTRLGARGRWSARPGSSEHGARLLAPPAGRSVNVAPCSDDDLPLLRGRGPRSESSNRGGGVVASGDSVTWPVFTF